MGATRRPSIFAGIVLVSSLVVSHVVTVSGHVDSAAQVQQNPGSAEPRKQSFILVRLADGYFEGAHGTFKTYKAPDGEFVWVILIHHQSDEDSRKFYKAVRDKAPVVKDEQILDDSGATKADTEVMVVPGKDGKRSLTSMFVRIGKEFRGAQSYSSPDALAMGELLKPH